MRFLDTNVLIRYFTSDDPIKAEAAYALMLRIERDDERVVISPLVIFEAIFLLERRYKIAKEDVREMVGDVLALRALQLAEKSVCRDALDLYVERNISYPDAYHAVWMQTREITAVYSWDRDFDRIPELTRIEPDTASSA
ncbi:MAG: PIN domain-containing protein [Thermomicrobiales bacterium]